MSPLIAAVLLAAAGAALLLLAVPALAGQESGGEAWARDDSADLGIEGYLSAPMFSTDGKDAAPWFGEAMPAGPAAPAIRSTPSWKCSA